MTCIILKPTQKAPDDQVTSLINWTNNELVERTKTSGLKNKAKNMNVFFQNYCTCSNIMASNLVMASRLLLTRVSQNLVNFWKSLLSAAEMFEADSQIHFSTLAVESYIFRLMRTRTLL